MDVQPPRDKVDISLHDMSLGIYGRKVSLSGIGGYMSVLALYSLDGGSLVDPVGGWRRMGNG